MNNCTHNILLHFEGMGFGAGISFFLKLCNILILMQVISHLNDYRGMRNWKNSVQTHLVPDTFLVNSMDPSSVSSLALSLPSKLLSDIAKNIFILS